jgi:hypothetical protein
VLLSTEIRGFEHNKKMQVAAIADINGDGCLDLFDALGDCHGNFNVLNETAMGLTALRANNRQYNLRCADFDGDGVEDLISNVYSINDVAASQALFIPRHGRRPFLSRIPSLRR